VSWRSS
jgi:hypothetical protein